MGPSLVGFLVLLLARSLSALPLAWVHALGAIGGRVVYACSPTYRRRLRANLAQAGLDGARLRREVIAESGKQALEMPWVWLRPAADLARVAKMEDLEGFAAFIAAPGPIVLLTPHLGCFEAIAQHYMLQEWGAARPMTALYRVPRLAGLRPLLEQARLRHGLRLASADLRGVRTLLRALKDGGVVGILPDQVPSRGDGVWTPFFGKPAYTMTLPARLAAGHRARVALMYAERLPGGRGFTIRWQPVNGGFSGDAPRDASLLNARLEDLIRRYPAQYLWAYNRYKAPPGSDAPIAPATEAPA